MNALLQLDFPAPATVDPRPMIIDSFAGGGGASTGIEMALGRSPDVAINHDEAALAMHEANHPNTLHVNSNVWQVDPAEVCRGRRVGLFWASPDCKDHSKAKGGKPVRKNIRDLAWVVVLWAKRARPEVIALENVEEFREWGPLDENGRRCTKRKGQTFDKWVKELRRLGYKVEWRELRACDYGAPTIRKRLFLIARRDGRPIVWPEPTHRAAPRRDGSVRVWQVTNGRVMFGDDNENTRWITAAEIIDWTQPVPSIFLTKEEAQAWGKAHNRRPPNRPLVTNTMKRIARGVIRYVIEAKEPFLVSYAQQGGGVRSGFEPFHTITASPKDQNVIIVPTLVQTGYGERKGQAPRVPGLEKPLGTVVAGGTKHALVAAFMAQHNGGERMENSAGRPAIAPLSTLTTRGTQQQIVAAHMMPHYGASVTRSATDPVGTITAGGGGKQAMVAAFMHKYYGTEQDPRIDQPIHTLTTKERFGLVTVEIQGEPYTITDIGMRMLTPREQFRAQGFPDSYEIEKTSLGTLTKTQQTRMCGNSVAPAVAAALIRANCQHLLGEGELA